MKSKPVLTTLFAVAALDGDMTLEEIEEIRERGGFNLDDELAQLETTTSNLRGLDVDRDMQAAVLN